ncbi:hypothetical protein AB0892_26150 [Streptomyces sp. NPDC005409]|uniref:hypothetical protein n=1 Tax=Streptomyces sp. NPDC005409 TaxID=3155342 RepID=UPI003452035D
MGADVRRKVADGSWTWAVAAALSAVAMALVGFGAGGPVALGLLFGLAALVATPLLLRRRPKAFAVVCVVVGAVMLPLGLLFALFGVLVFLPPGPLLIVAAYADRRNRPDDRVVILAVATSVAATLAFMAL